MDRTLHNSVLSCFTDQIHSVKFESKRCSYSLDQPSLGMMSREYFLDDSESKYKDAYLRYMISIAELLGANHSHAVKEMTEVLDFEVKLANVSFSLIHL